MGHGSHCKHQPFSASQGILQSPNLGYDSLLWQISLPYPSRPYS